MSYKLLVLSVLGSSSSSKSGEDG
jgi:hypothetical protein